jgi:hypothetical protein
MAVAHRPGSLRFRAFLWRSCAWGLSKEKPRRSGPCHGSVQPGKGLTRAAKEPSRCAGWSDDRPAPIGRAMRPAPVVNEAGAELELRMRIRAVNVDARVTEPWVPGAQLCHPRRGWSRRSRRRRRSASSSSARSRGPSPDPSRPSPKQGKARVRPKGASVGRTKHERTSRAGTGKAS